MKKLSSIILAIILVFSTMVVAGAQTVDVAQTGVNTELFDGIVDYIVSNSTNDSGTPTVTFSYKTDTVDLVCTSPGEIQLQFSRATTKLEETGTITLYKSSNSAKGYMYQTVFTSYSYIKINTEVQGMFDMQKTLENDEINFINGTFKGPDDKDLQTSTVKYVKAAFLLKIATVNVCLYEKLGYSLNDVYANNSNENNNSSNGNSNGSSTEATDDEVTPTEVVTSTEVVTPTEDNSTNAGPAIKTGHGFVPSFVLIISVLAFAVMFIANAYYKKQHMNK